MQKFYYSALDVAAIIDSMDVGFKQECHILRCIWKNENDLLDSQCNRMNYRKFLLKVYYWMYYLHEKDTLDQEFPMIQKDLTKFARSLPEEQYIANCSNLDLYFKSVRIRILYGGGNDYVRIKLRSLLKQYGYKRRSQGLLEHIDSCMRFYHLEATLRGGRGCDISTVLLDKMLTFRVV